MQYLVLDNIWLKDNYLKLILEIPGGASIPLPGQFYTIRCGDSMDPLLRRPFSMHRLVEGENSKHLEILYLVIGRSTKWLSKRKRGEYLDLIGPFGNGFIVDRAAKDVVLVARGIGIAPLYAVGEALHSASPDGNIHILIGAQMTVV